MHCELVSQSVASASAHTSDESVSQWVDQLVCALPDSVGPILAKQVSLGIFFRSRIIRETFNSSPYLGGQLVPSHLVPSADRSNAERFVGGGVVWWGRFVGRGGSWCDGWGSSRSNHLGIQRSTQVETCERRASPQSGR